MDLLRRVRWGRVLVALLLLGALTASLLAWKKGDAVNPYAPPADFGLAPPVEYSVPLWDELLGGDEAITDADWQALDDPSSSDLGEEDAVRVASLARGITVADLTGAGRDAWSSYWVTGSSLPTCTDVSILAASAMELPVEGVDYYAKTLVAWKGSCSDGPTSDEVSISYVYARDRGEQWVPLREWDLPIPATVESVPVSGPAAYELKPLAECGAPENTEVLARILVANAWEVMCEDAQEDGVELLATSGWRSRTEQVELFKEAVEYYGSESEARRWVAPADDTTCSSKHCAGTAIDVAGEKTLLWLNEMVGCNSNGTVTTGVKECPSGAAPIKRMQLYGFLAPVPYVPQYLEFTLPIEGEGAAADCAPLNSNVPTMVAQIFRCRLQAAGITGEEQASVVAEALVVSRCESAWNPLALAYGGRFREQPHPLSGKTYDQAGVFMLSRAEATEVMNGGYAAVTDPVANINGAASLWLSTRNWSHWGCATGRGELFESGPVLPAYGGPEVPAWALEY